MDTKVYLIRHGITEWHVAGKLLGNRDIPLNETGVKQAEATARALASLDIAEVISSPLLRALQSAEIIGHRFGIEIARDPRLVDLRVGRWEGMRYPDITATEEYRRFVESPSSERIPDGESFAEVERRAVSAIEQALEDNPTGDAICMVTHANVIRVLLSRYLGYPPAAFHRLRISPGSVTVLSFAGETTQPRVLTINWHPELGGLLKA